MIQHAFTTRKGGLGGGRKEVKLPGYWSSIAPAFGVTPDRLVTLSQVHGENVVIVDYQNYSHLMTLQGDAMITHIRGLAIGVETADCVPVLLFDPATPAVAAIHAGWRSTVKKIVQKTVLRMKESFNTDPRELIAAIGPAIGPECYEIDEPVMERVRSVFPFWQELTAPRSRGRWSLNLVMTNMKELLNNGLQEENIHALDMCTSCRNDLFYSFRAEGRTGRMLSAIGLKP
ncbi:MAG TPA: peptidoglycan editing factor PgeF [Nitrospirota bacterium]|nr:peptidoglycan editing factor PgeF [Nitrospirota bacterium]